MPLRPHARTAIVAAILALVTAACGDDQPAATSADTTTTTATTTATTDPPARPWTTLPPQAAPEPQYCEGFAALAGAETICLEADAEGTAVVPVAERGAAARTFAALGFQVAEQGCDAVLTVELDGRRTSAEYQDDGSTTTCWSGRILEGTITLTVDDALLEQWAVGYEIDPPPGVSGCAGPDEPFDAHAWHSLLMEPLADGFGNVGLAAGLVHLDVNDRSPAFTAGFYDDPAVPDLLAALLTSAEESDAAGAAAVLAELADPDRLGPQLAPDLLTAVVPHLIAFAAGDPTRGAHSAEMAIRRITDAPSGPLDLSEAWQWWEENG